MTVDYVTSILWKTSRLNGASWVNCVLTLADGVLELQSEGGVIFRWPAQQVVARFTVFGEMLVSNVEDGSTMFTLSVYANWTTPSPEPAQVEHLRRAEVQMVSRQRSRWIMTEWRNSLSLAGAKVAGSSGNGVARLVCICVVGLVASTSILIAAIVAAGRG